ncbi:MAG: DUF262 domain-containing HNH endonuclease family protein [Nostoc sp. DedQUE08]|uniref:DUF262 domain-containing protein n=1 Tax=unclassified Nostoc TaxID=2593658 RepID=UPI002AD2009E|nr:MULTISPECIES: DUF262 domain-containing HNH endonuclease family protein [unclassified Nostoc]MDZ8067218.1 DUF262 domain-containing HNH endonuclease family protein [Nostoc sp. DedQUE08]MDZ8091192.1 DUF262 domain-containing HNH endonuclease family protein [Nostoc sp. DedQUE05]
MKIEANDKEVQDIFALGYFKIPRFQRPYSWTDEEVKDFWDDVVIRDYEHYFIGSMVVYQTEKPYYGIVDGQQRLTTITLMLAAIRNAFLDYGDENLAKGVHQYIEKANIDNIPEYVLNSETSFPYLQGYIQSFNKAELQCNVGSEEQNLKSAFELINKKLYDIIPKFDSKESCNALSEERISPILETLKSLRKKVLSLKLVFIQLDNEDDAYLIFETLNTRGKDLTTPDLVKNLILQKLRASNITLDTYKVIWNGILEKFDNNGLEQTVVESFLYHHWLSKYGDTTQKQLFGEIKKYIDSSSKNESENKSRLLLLEFQKNSDYYVSIVSPDNHQWSPEEKNSIYQSLKALRLFNVKQQTSMILSLMRAYRENKITLKALRPILWKIECFHFIFNSITSQRSSGSIAPLYSKYAQELSNTDNLDKIQSINTNLIRKLKEKLPSLDEFEVNFMDLIYTKNKQRDKKVIQYILEKFIGQNINGLPIDYNSASIEHLLAESKGEEEIVGRIGNLILVDKTTNSEELKNYDFLKKIEILKDKKYPLDNYLLKANQWTEEEIKERGKAMSHKAYNEIWKL